MQCQISFFRGRCYMELICIKDLHLGIMPLGVNYVKNVNLLLHMGNEESEVTFAVLHFMISIRFTLHGDKVLSFF